MGLCLSGCPRCGRQNLKQLAQLAQLAPQVECYAAGQPRSASGQSWMELLINRRLSCRAAVFPACIILRTTVYIRATLAIQYSPIVKSS